MEMRCPKHDRIFETVTDHRKPDAPASGSFKAHPVGGHPDCSLCQREAQGRRVLSREQVKAAARDAGIPFDLAAQQAVAAGYELATPDEEQKLIADAQRRTVAAGV
jgi:hypothetical protein